MQDPKSQLLIIAIGYFLFCFSWPWLRIRQMIGKNPIAFSRGSGLKPFVGKTFLTIILVETATAFIFSIAPKFYEYLSPQVFLHHSFIQQLGFVLLLFSIAVTASAQYQMGSSWRIGIDEDSRTELVIKGLYHYSRNPIYTGMLFGAIGFFLFLPNAVTLACLAAGYLILRVEIHLEEEHMLRLHPQQYAEYMAKVRRWL